MTSRSFPLELYALGIAFLILVSVAYAVHFLLRHKRISFLESFALSIVCTSVGLSLISLLGLCFSPESRGTFAIGCFGFIAVSSVLFLIWYQLKMSLLVITKQELIMLGSFLLLVTCSFSITYTEVRHDQPLLDGAYVDKEDVLPVTVQKIVGNWPADNAVPFVAQEYLAKDISFKNNHPILPGQEVVNRPILLSLVSLPFRWALTKFETVPDPLPLFKYSNADWPDYRILLRDQEAFGLFLAIGILFNATIILGAGLFGLGFFNMGSLSLFLFGLLFATSPYFAFHTLFTWPKNLAAFFILAATYFHFRNFKTAIVGFCFGLAYLSHPYAAIYTAIFSMYLMLKPGEILERVKRVIPIVIFFCVATLPWLTWTKLVLRFENDLFAQNFFSSGQSLADFIWVRVYNVGEVLAPLHWHTYPFDIKKITSLSVVNIFGATGSLFLGDALLSQAKLSFSNEARHIFLILVASCSMLLVLFSVPSMVIAHGLQPALALFVVYSVGRLAKKRDKMIVIAQILLNVVFAVLYLQSL